MSIPILEAKQLEISLEGRPLHLRPLSFKICSGKITALIGPNGSGKTTLMRVLLNDLNVARGECWFNNEKRLASLVPNELSQIMAFVPQDQGHFSDHRVVETLTTAFFPELGLFAQPSLEQKELVRKRAKQFGLDLCLEKPLARLSQGERQRVFLLRAILRRPKILLLDEPTNHLDPGACAVFWNQVEALRKQDPSLAVLASTHDLNWVREGADEVIALSKRGIEFQLASSEVAWKDLLPSLYYDQVT